ncbi:MAG: sensor histidine kinase, partial [Ottowia sp.]|nr:sensor histidine kinase [Ottowia sp.]
HAALLREPTDLPALAREVLAQLAKTQPRVVQTVLVVDPGFPATVAVDTSRCRLLLRNILDNAWRHTPADAPAPELRLSRQNPDAVTITLRDHGPGVPEAQRQHLAEAFYRPDSARQRASGGVGLGLYLVRLVAQAHGGRVQFEDGAPGLVVRVELPAA